MAQSYRDYLRQILNSAKSWAWQSLIAIDQLFNALLGGMADETLSSRAFRAEAKGRIFGIIFRPTIDFIFFFDKEHCFNSFISEVKRRHLPPDFQKI